MKKRISLDSVIEKQNKNNEFKLAFKRELLINDIAKLVYSLRNEAEFTQKELADKSGTTQPVIARLEKGNDTRIPSLELLTRIAAATGNKLQVSVSH